MSGHHHPSSKTTLLWALSLTLGFAVVEAISGWLTNSLALMGDAGHMLTDASALGLAAFAAWLVQRPPSHRHSYGLARAEVLATIINSVFMLLIVMGLAIAAINRLQNPSEVHGLGVTLVAAVGLIINLLVAWLLHRGEQTLNTRAAMLHVMGDLLGSVAALLSGLIIYLTDWYTIDPILSLLICVLILISSLRLLREAIHIVMEGVPQHIKLPEVGRAMASVEGVSSVHDLHIWTVSSNSVALSAHVVVRKMDDWQRVLQQLQALLDQRFHIHHSTLQPEVNERPIELPRHHSPPDIT